MKKITAIALAIAALVSGACSSGPKTGPSGVVEKTADYVVVNYQGKDFGGEVPEWVKLRESSGMTAVEALDQYKNSYCFISIDTGKNINALRNWAAGFSVPQEMARMVSTRIDARFAGAAVGSPDTEYGSYYENVVRNAARAQFSGARKEADFWILRRYKADQREEYTYYVLVTVDRPTFEQQINDVLNGTKTDEPLTTEQQAAVDRVREAFYEGF